MDSSIDSDDSEFEVITPSGSVIEEGPGQSLLPDHAANQDYHYSITTALIPTVVGDPDEEPFADAVKEEVKEVFKESVTEAVDEQKEKDEDDDELLVSGRHQQRLKAALEHEAAMPLFPALTKEEHKEMGRVWIVGLAALFLVAALNHYRAHRAEALVQLQKAEIAQLRNDLQREFTFHQEHAREKESLEKCRQAYDEKKESFEVAQLERDNMKREVAGLRIQETAIQAALKYAKEYAEKCRQEHDSFTEDAARDRAVLKGNIDHLKADIQLDKKAAKDMLKYAKKSQQEYDSLVEDKAKERAVLKGNIDHLKAEIHLQRRLQNDGGSV